MPVIGVRAIRWHSLPSESRKHTSFFLEIVDVGTASFYEILRLRQQRAPDRSFHLAEPPIETHHIGKRFGIGSVSDGLGVIADEPQFFSKLVVIRQADTAFAGVNMLVIIQAEHTDVAERARLATSI